MTITEVARLLVAELKANDIIVLECERRITIEQAEWLRSHITAEIGPRPVLILAPGFKLSVISPEDDTR